MERLEESKPVRAKRNEGGKEERDKKLRKEGREGDGEEHFVKVAVILNYRTQCLQNYVKPADPKCYRTHNAAKHIQSVKQMQIVFQSVRTHF